MTRASPRGTSRLRDFLESNPVVLLIGVGVSVATVVAALMEYATSQKIDDLKIQYKTEISTLKEKSQEDAFEVAKSFNQQKEDLNEKISALDLQLNSIIRRVPGTGPAYFDVASVFIKPGDVQTLGPPQYHSFDNDGFFVSVPPGSDWNFHMTNEYDILASMYSWIKGEADPPQILASARASPVFAWQNNSKIQILPQSPSFGGDIITLRPLIYVQHVDQTLLIERTAASAGVDVNILRQKIAGSLNTSKTGLTLDAQQNPNSDILDIPANQLMSDQAPDQLVSALNDLRMQDKLIALENFLKTDLVSYVFGETVFIPNLFNGTLTIHHFFAHQKVLSAQEKNDVFYLQIQNIFDDADVITEDGTRTRWKNVVLNEEVFYFSRHDDGYLVRVYLPPVPDHADVFAWSIGWLTRLRIPKE